MNIQGEMDHIKHLYNTVIKISEFENNSMIADPEIAPVQDSLNTNDVDKFIF